MSRFTDVTLQNSASTIVHNYESKDVVSLAKALAPICSRMNSLTNHMKLALRECYYPSKHGLTRDESAAIYLYTSEWGNESLYRVLNAILRSGNSDQLRDWLPYLTLFTSAINKLPTVKKSVWRGISNDISRNLKKDEVITWSSASSCSTSIDVIKHFLSSQQNAWKNLFTKQHSTLVMLEIHNGKDVAGYTKFPTEHEVILAPGTKLRVVSDALHHAGGLHVMHLEEISAPKVVQIKSPSNNLHAKQILKIFFSFLVCYLIHDLEISSIPIRFLFVVFILLFAFFLRM